MNLHTKLDRLLHEKSALDTAYAETFSRLDQELREKGEQIRSLIASFDLRSNYSFEIPRKLNDELLIYIDPGFFSDWGHYISFATLIHEEARKRKVDLWHFTTDDVSEEEASRFSLIKLFRYRAILGDDHGLIPPVSVDGDFTFLEALNKGFFDDHTDKVLRSFRGAVESILDSAASTPSYRKISLYMYTSHPVYMALFAEMLGLPEYKDVNISVHLCLFYLHLEFCSGKKVPEYESLLWFTSQSLEKYDVRGRIKIYADSERTLNMYAPYFRRQIHPSPIPLNNAGMSAAPQKKTRAKGITIGFFGFAHEKQGYHLFKELYDALVHDKKYSHVNFVVRHNSKFSPPEMLSLAMQFYRRHERIIHLRGNFLAPETYAQHVSACDIIAIPHSKSHYPCQTSGLFTDAVMKEKIVIVPRETWMADQLKEYGSGRTFETDNAASFIGAVKEVIDDFTTYLSQVKRNIDTFRGFHTVGTVFDVIGVGVHKKIFNEYVPGKREITVTMNPSIPRKIIVHHLGKAGEGLLSLPMARVLRRVYPAAHIEWVVLDRYRAFIGDDIFIDSVVEVPSSDVESLTDIGQFITHYHKHVIPYKPVSKDNETWHCNAYCNYIVKTDDNGKQLPMEIPFYKQFFQNLPFQNHEWFAPTWTARQIDIDEGNKFLESNGISEDQKLIIVSPFVADKTIPLSGADEFIPDWPFVAEKLKTFNLPIIFTGTEFDERLIPHGCIDAFAPRLSLGGLFHLIQTKTHLAVCGNSGIGFAALFLKSNLLMYDNRKTWTEHTHTYENRELHRSGDLWPMFDAANMKDDTPDWESSWIHRRWYRKTVGEDIATFQLRGQPKLEVLSHNVYPESTYALANKLLNVRGHKYEKLPPGSGTCRVSVLVSLYKAKDYIIQRLSNLLDQTEQDIEVIVIDPASPDHDGQEVWDRFGSDPRVTVIKISHRLPLYSAWNIGLAFSRGKYICNANADDLIDPTTLKQMADWLDENSHMDLLAGGWYEVKGQYNRWPATVTALISDNKAPGHFPMWRRILHSGIGLFDDSYKIVGDIEWWIRLLVKGKKIAKSMTPVGSYLDHGANLFHTGKTRRLQEIESSGWPYFHKVLYDQTSYVDLPEALLPGTPINFPKEGDDLTAFRDKHLGERCFIMGNGPSLNKMDLSKLEGEIVFGCNACYLLFDRVKWRPRYYSFVDSRVLPDRGEETTRMHEENPEMILFFPSKLHFHDGSKTIKDTTEYIPRANNRYFFNHVFMDMNKLPWSAFSLDVNNHVVMPQTVSITLLQLAFYMGFKDIYLIGCDTSYKVSESVIQEGPIYGEYGKLLFTSTKDDDPNHFDPRYFGVGKKWHNPKVGEMIKHYEWSKRVINACGGKVYNATVGGNLEVFPRVNFDDLFK